MSASAIRINQVTLTTAHAGERDASHATAGIAGVDNKNTTVKNLRVVCKESNGNNNAQVIRIFIKKISGPTYYFQGEISIPANTATVAETTFVTAGGTQRVPANPAYSRDFPCNYPLPSSDYCMAYDQETGDDFGITETAVDF